MITPDEATQLMDIATQVTWKRNSQRGAALVALMYSSGARVSEATAEIVEKNRRLCLGAQPVNQLIKTKKIVSRLVRAAKKHVKIRLLLLDREFFSTEVMQTLNRHRVPWLMPVVKNKEIRRKTQAIY